MKPGPGKWHDLPTSPWIHWHGSNHNPKLQLPSLLLTSDKGNRCKKPRVDSFLFWIILLYQSKHKDDQENILTAKSNSIKESWIGYLWYTLEMPNCKNLSLKLSEGQGQTLTSQKNKSWCCVISTWHPNLSDCTFKITFHSTHLIQG
jgi:hypothetical protein